MKSFADLTEELKLKIGYIQALEEDEEEISDYFLNKLKELAGIEYVEDIYNDDDINSLFDNEKNIEEFNVWYKEQTKNF